MNMMKNQQQPMMNGGGEANGGSPTPGLLTQWWYKGPDGETYGPYSPREMHTWSRSGYFSENLAIKTDKDEMFHSIGDWQMLMSGASPFINNTVPAFNMLAHSFGQQHPQQFMMFPPGLPAPQPSSGSFGSAQSAAALAAAAAAAAAGRFGGNGFPPNGNAPPAAQMAALHLGGGGAPNNMGMHHHISHHSGGPLSQPPSEPNDCANSSASHSPDSGEQDFRAMHHMGMPPPMAGMGPGAQRMPPFYHGGAMQSMQLQQQHQQQLLQQQQHASPMSAANAGVLSASGQVQYSRTTSTHDAPWNIRKDVSVDASQRPPQRVTMQTQTLPVIIGSKDASRWLSELTGCQIVIT